MVLTDACCKCRPAPATGKEKALYSIVSLLQTAHARRGFRPVRPAQPVLPKSPYRRSHHQLAAVSARPARAAAHPGHADRDRQSLLLYLVRRRGGGKPKERGGDERVWVGGFHGPPAPGRRAFNSRRVLMISRTSPLCSICCAAYHTLKVGTNSRPLTKQRPLWHSSSTPGLKRPRHSRTLMSCTCTNLLLFVRAFQGLSYTPAVLYS